MLLILDKPHTGRTPNRNGTMEEALLKQTRDLIASRTGLLMRDQDDAMLHKVVAERVKVLNLSGVEQYCQLLESDAYIRHEREEIATHLTTGETYFFRDSGQHVLLQNRILPPFPQARGHTRCDRRWSTSPWQAHGARNAIDRAGPSPHQWGRQPG